MDTRDMKDRLEAYVRAAPPEELPYGDVESAVDWEVRRLCDVRVEPGRIDFVFSMASDHELCVAVQNGCDSCGWGTTYLVSAWGGQIP